MSLQPKPWRKSEIAQPICGSAIREPDAVVQLLDKAKRPLLIAGHRVAYPDNENEAPYLEHILRLAKTRSLPVVACSNTVKAFLDAKHPVASWLSSMDTVNRLCDPNWKGFDGKGPYDLVMMTGLPYEMTEMLLNTLKHFTAIKTVCLDRYYQPNATLAYPNLRSAKWLSELERLTKLLGQKTESELKPPRETSTHGEPEAKPKRVPKKK